MKIYRDMPEFHYLVDNHDGVVVWRKKNILEMDFVYYVVCMEEPNVQTWQTICFCNGREVMYCIQ